MKERRPEEKSSGEGRFKEKLACLLLLFVVWEEELVSPSGRKAERNKDEFLGC